MSICNLGFNTWNYTLANTNFIYLLSSLNSGLLLHLPPPPHLSTFFDASFQILKDIRLWISSSGSVFPQNLLCYSRHRSHLVLFAVNDLPSILSSVTSVPLPPSHRSFPLSGQTHLFLCSFPDPDLKFAFSLSTDDACTLPPCLSQVILLLTENVLSISLSFQALLRSHLFQLSLQPDPHQFGGGGKNSLLSLICLWYE